MTTTEDQPDPALELVQAALIAKLAAALGCPRLAVRAARRAGALADALVIASSPAVARTSMAAETLALDGVRTTADLCAVLRPELGEVEER